MFFKSPGCQELPGFSFSRAADFVSHDGLDRKCYIGIDVAKAKLDVCILSSGEHFVVANNTAEIEELAEKIIRLHAREEVHIAMESTGGYEQLALKLLGKFKLRVSILNPRQVRDFAKSLNKLAKTDKIDASIIAQYAQMVKPRETMQNREVVEKMEELAGRRQQLLDMIQAENNRLEKKRTYTGKSIERIVEQLKKELREIEKELDETVNEDKDCVEKRNLLMSVKGIGKVTAQALIANLPELGYLNGKQISALSGLAPFNRDSGTFRGKRTVWGGRKVVRTSLHMATLVAIKHNAYIRAFYQRLLAAGKAKMVAVTAAMHKLLLILNAMVKSNSLWDEKKEKRYLETINTKTGALVSCES